MNSDAPRPVRRQSSGWASLLLLTGALLASALARAETDPFIGTWTLLPERSNYAGGNVPQSMQIVIEPADAGVHYRSSTVTKDGRTVTAEYTALYGGPPALVAGNAGLLAPVALTRVDGHTVDAVYERALQPVATSHWVIAADGETLTITTQSRERGGALALNIGVYRRAAAAAEAPAGSPAAN